MFVHYLNTIVNTKTISKIEYQNLAEGYVRVYYVTGNSDLVEGPEAFDLVMRLCPAATEGHAFRRQRRRWAIHNLIGHPLLQFFSWLGLTRLGLAIHDATVPIPITK